MAGTVFIFGLGYVGRPLGHLLASRGWHIRGTTRTPERLAVEVDAGWQVYRFADDVPLTDPEEALHGVDAVLSTITAIGGSDPVLDAHGDVLSGFTGWSGYVSATSVYPDRPEGFCYEDTPTDPATKRGRARVIAEARWLPPHACRTKHSTSQHPAPPSPKKIALRRSGGLSGVPRTRSHLELGR